MKTPPIVSPQEWEAARQDQLVNEKESTRARDALAAARRRMPRMAVEKEYRFRGDAAMGSTWSCRGLLDRFSGLRWIHRSTATRAVQITESGRAGLNDTFGVCLH